MKRKDSPRLYLRYRLSVDSLIYVERQDGRRGNASEISMGGLDYTFAVGSRSHTVERIKLNWLGNTREHLVTNRYFQAGRVGVRFELEHVGELEFVKAVARRLATACNQSRHAERPPAASVSLKQGA